MIRSKLLLLSLLLISANTTAQIYKVIDENGRVTYTDQPGSGKQMETVELPHLNSQEPEPLASEDDPESATPAEAEPALTYSLAITSPRTGLQMPTGQTTLEVNVSLSPGLEPEHQLQALLNGEPFGEASRSTQLILQYLHRGENLLSVAVIDENGTPLAESPSIIVYVQRPSLNSPAR